MPNPAAIRAERLRKTKAQLIDEIGILEQRAALTEAVHKSDRPIAAKASDRYLADQEIADLARYPSENPNPVLRVKPDGTLLYVNAAAMAVKGLVRGVKKSRLARDLAGVCAEALDTARILESEFESHDRFFTFSIAPVADAPYINIYGRDITARKRAEQEIERQRELLRLTLENMDQAIGVWDADFNLVSFNNNLKRSIDLPEALMAIGTPVEDWYWHLARRGEYQPGDVYGSATVEEAVAARMQSLRERRSPHHERMLADGRIVLLRRSFMPEGGFVTTYTDITERKQAEEALAKKEAQLRIALENMPGGLALNDGALVYTVVNQQARDICELPDHLMTPGGSVEEVVRFSAARGDYGPGQVDELANQRLDAVRQGEQLTLEVQLPGGRYINIRRRRLDDGSNVSVFTDITQRHRVEQEALQKTRILELTLEHMGQGLTMYDADWNLVSHNQKYAEHFDLPEDVFDGERTFDAVVGATMLRDYGDQWQERLAVVRDPSRMTDVWRREFARPDGRSLDLLSNPIPTGGFVVTSTDITERKRAEDELQKSREQLQALADNLPESISLKDPERRFVFVNKRFEEWLCLDRNDVIGKTVHDIYPQEQATEFDALDQRAIDNRQVLSQEDDLSFPDGKMRTVIRTRYPVISFQGEVLGLGTVNRDITERRRAEAKHIEGEERLKLALKGGDLGFWDINFDSDSMVANERWAEMLGYTLDEVDDLRDVALATFHPDDFERVREYNQRSNDGEITDYEIEYRVITKQRETRWLLSKGETVQLNEQGMPRRIVGTVMDITERKRAEEALHEAKRRSEEASALVSEKNRMLESLSTQLSKYLSPQVYASIFSGKQSVEIASKRKKLTVFFSDIADFTGITDSLESEELTNFLNHYLTEMSKIALDHGATIDKYVGDAIVAFFGDPETRGVKEDAITCVTMAIAMQRRMRELQTEWLAMGLDRPFELRIGINTGFCTVGNFGSRDRMDYTIIGNEVNLTARLESHAEVGSILMAHKTYLLVKDTIMAEEGDSLNVKGFANPVRTYSVVGQYDDLAEQGRIIHKELGGVRVLVDLQTGDRADAVQAIKDVLSELQD